MSCQILKTVCGSQLGVLAKRQLIPHFYLELQESLWSFSRREVYSQVREKIASLI